MPPSEAGIAVQLEKPADLPTDCIVFTVAEAASNTLVSSKAGSGCPDRLAFGPVGNAGLCGQLASDAYQCKT